MHDSTVHCQLDKRVHCQLTRAGDVLSPYSYSYRCISTSSILRRPRQEPRKPPGNPTPPGQNRETTRTGKRATATKEKQKKNKSKGWAWPWCRCRQRSTGRRRSARAGRRNTRGTPNPVWDSPALGRKRRRKKHGVDEQTRQREDGGH